MKDLKIVAASSLEALKNMGAQSASVSATYSETREFNVDGGEFSLFRTLFDNSLVLTAIKDAKKGTAQVNHFDDESIAGAAADCIAAADASEPDEAWEFAPSEGEHSFCEGVYDPDLDLLFERCREFMADLTQQHPSIMMEQMIVKHRKVDTVFATSNGSVFTEKGGYYNISLMYSAHEGDKSSSFFGSDVSTTDLSVPFMQLGSIKRDLTDVEKQIYPKPVEGKFEGTVVFTPGCFMEAVYYALASFTDGSSILDGTSLWKDKLGEKVANDCLTVTLAPHREGTIGGDNWTSEGYLTEDCDIIKGGVLQSFLMNKYFANKTGHERTKNMDIGCMVVPAGDKSIADIIAGIDRGLVVSRVSGGNPASSGDFSMVAKNSFIIENGKVGDSVSEVMINGNLAEILCNIRAISSDVESNGGYLMPWAAFDGVTISGK